MHSMLNAIEGHIAAEAPAGMAPEEAQGEPDQ